MRVLLIHPADFPDPRRPPPILPPNQAPPLGLAYIAAALREAGHEPRILDLRHRPLEPAQLAQQVADFAPGLVGMGLYTVTVPVARAISRLVKEHLPSAVVLVGGPHPAGAPEECARDPRFDFAAVGEGERTTVELASALESGGDVSVVKGLWFERDGEVVHTGARPWITELDDLPLPARDLLPPLDSYQMTMFQYREWPATTLYTSRGCPYSCTFCERTAILGNRFRVHGPRYVVDELEHLQREYGIREVFFYDDTFTFDRKRVEGICREILDRGVHISWNISTHVGNVDRALLTLMRQAGCWQIAYGIETGDPQVMRDISKGTTLEQVRERIGWTLEAGIEAKGLFMLGHPTDTAETIERTIAFACELPLASANFKLTIPFVGTELRQFASDYGELREDDYAGFMGDAATPVFVTDGLTAEYLLGVQRRAYARFYGSPRRALRLARSAAGGPGNLGKWLQGGVAMARLARHLLLPGDGPMPALDPEHG